MEKRRMKSEEDETTLPQLSSNPPQPTSTTINPLSHDDDSNQSKQIASPSPPSSSNNVNKAKSCKGCLYYSSHFKAGSRNPLCVGLTRSLPSVPQYIVGQAEVEAAKEGRRLADFRYACVGYSLYPDQKGENASNDERSPTELPVCVGLEILMERRANSTDPASAPAPAPTPTHVYNREDGNGLPQRQSPKPSHSAGEEFLTRFSRNAKLVANGVAKNVRKVNNQIKQSIDDILYPYRKRPK